MKHLFLLFGFLLAAFTAQAATITQEGVTPADGAGLYYNLYDDGTAVIVKNPDNSIYSMESLAIPATVTYNGVTYLYYQKHQRWREYHENRTLCLLCL